MLGYQRFTIILLIVAGLQMTAFQPAAESAAPKKNGPAKVERIGNSDLSRITITPKAAERLDVKTAAVREEKMTPKKNGNGKVVGTAGMRKVIPYSAVIYDVNGDTWTYTSPQKNVFVRHKINVEYISGNQAILFSGPPAGTLVVTIGVAELYGVEMGIGK